MCLQFVEKPQVKSHTLVENLKPVLKTQVYLGIKRFPMNNNCNDTVTWKNRIYSLVILFLSIISFVDLAIYTPIDLRICYLKNVVSKLVLFKITLTVLMVSLRRRPEAEEICKLTTAIDHELGLSNNEEFNMSRKRSNFLTFLLFISTYLVIVIYDIMVSGLFSNLNSIYMLFGCLTHDLDILTFLMLTNEMKLKVRLINRNITKNILKESNECACEGKDNNILCSLMWKLHVCYENFVNPNVNNLLHVSVLMEDVVKTCRRINTLYNMQLLQMVVSKFAFVLLLIDALLNPTGMKQFFSHDFRIYVTLFVSLQLLFMHLVCITCEKVARETGKTAAILNRILGDCHHDEKNRRRAKSIVRMLETSPPKFKLYGVFELSLGLMLKFVSIVTTYVIVLMQYTDMEKVG